MRVFWLLLAGLTSWLGIIGLVWAVAAYASPPSTTPGPNADWFHGLKRNDRPYASCCDEADCKVVKAREVQGHYEVLYKGGWLPVEDKAILRPRDNPVGEPIACINPNLTDIKVLCFVPGPKV